MNPDNLTPRNVFLVLAWTFGLFVLMNFYQFAGFLLASRMSGATFGEVMRGEFSNPRTDLAMSLSALLVGIPLVFLCARFLWGRSFEWMRLQFDLKFLALGLLLGLPLPGILLLVLKWTGVATIQWSPATLKANGTTLLGIACLAIFTGLAEETIFRGMATREFALRYGWIIATLIGGTYFGAVHLISIHQGLTVGRAAWILLAGLLVSSAFVAMYVRSGSLWLPIGFHIAWNFCLQGILGITMSGGEARAGLFSVQLSGSPILTGGSFGIEASAIALAAYAVLALLFVFLPWGGQVLLLGSK